MGVSSLGTVHCGTAEDNLLLAAVLPRYCNGINYS